MERMYSDGVSKCADVVISGCKERRDENVFDKGLEPRLTGTDPTKRPSFMLCDARLVACEEAVEGGGVMVSRCDKPNGIIAFVVPVPSVLVLVVPR